MLVISFWFLFPFKYPLITKSPLCVFQTANAMEMLLLSVLGPELRCVWHLDSSQVALITTVNQSQPFIIC